MTCHDDPIVCAALRALLGQQFDIEVVGDASAAQVAAVTKRLAPDAVLVASPALTVEHTKELRAVCAHARVLLIARADDLQRSVLALHAGVRAVLSPDTSPERLVQVLRMVVEGDALVIPVAARAHLDSAPVSSAPRTGRRGSIDLTPRETEVILLLAQGRSNAEIARHLSISMATVRSHVHRLLRKIGAVTRAQAVAISYRTGLIHDLERQSG